MSESIGIKKSGQAYVVHPIKADNRIRKKQQNNIENIIINEFVAKPKQKIKLDNKGKKPPRSASRKKGSGSKVGGEGQNIKQSAPAPLRRKAQVKPHGQQKQKIYFKTMSSDKKQRILLLCNKRFCQAVSAEKNENINPVKSKKGKKAIQDIFPAEIL